MHKTINRITVLFLALILTFTTIYDTSVKVEASSVVIGGAVVGGETLIDFLVGVAVIAVCGICGSQAEQSDAQYIREHMEEFLSTDIGSSAFKDYADKSSITDIHNLSVDQALSTTVSGIDMTSELSTFLSLFYDYLEDSGEMADLDKGVYFVYDCLPDNWYIGYNSSIVPEAVSADSRYNVSAAHMQVESSYGYLDLQETGSYVYSSYPSTRSDGYYDCLTYNTQYRYGSLCYVLSGGTVTFPSGQVYNPYGDLQYNKTGSAAAFTYINSSLAYTTDVYRGFPIQDDNLYISPSATMPFSYVSGDHKYVLTPTGLYDGLASDAPAITASRVVTGADAKPSLKSLAGSVSGFWDRVSDKVISGTDTADQPKTYSKDAINSIYNNVAKYYDQTVENYYNDTSYITGDTYVENVTNIYNEAVVDYPVPAVPDVELGSISQYTVTGLSQVFPFCIPFDMYDLMGILCADPHAISFDVTIDFGYFGEHTISIDLSVFDPVAKIFRTMELLLYAFGLMFWTRNLIRG